MSVEYRQPPPGQPMSIGGYAPFARLIGPDGETVYSGAVNAFTRIEQPPATNQVFELSGGEYTLDVSVRAASDAISIDQNGTVQRDFGPVTATCSAMVHVSPQELSAVTITLVGGSSCSISLAS